MSAMPEWLVPMAATLTQERFAGGDWIFERKFDGIRLLAFKRGGDVRLYSRNRLPQELPALADAIRRLPVDEAILDGEITWDRQTLRKPRSVPISAWNPLHGKAMKRRSAASQR